jgi:Prokaryotic homologs of the JAB domain
MNDPGFTVEGVRHDVPFRPRSSFADYWQFTDQASAVLVAPAMAHGLRAAARIARPNETGGLLSGRAFRDGGGTYVVVAGWVEAPCNAGRVSGFTLSPDATARLRKEACLSYPTADVVGWWHSHPCPSGYSQIDLGQQRIWTQPESVGVLVFADGGRWGAVYQGPAARLMSGPQGLPAWPPRGRAPDGGRFAVPSQLIPSPPAPEGSGKIPRRKPAPRRRLYGALALAMSGAIVIGAISLGRIAAGQKQLSGQLAHIAPVAPRQMWLNWSCAPQPLPGIYICVAELSGPSGTVEWQLDGRTISRGLVTSIQLPAGNATAHQVRVLVRNHTGTYNGGSQIIY